MGQSGSRTHADNSAIALADLAIVEIEQHFRHFLLPSNLFLVPKAIGGLGELLHMCTIMKGRA